MGLWDNIVDGFKSGMAGKGPNYVKKQRAAQARLEGLMALAALRAYKDYRREQSRWREGATKRGGHDKQYIDGDVKVLVVNGFSDDENEYTTDIKVIHRDPSIKQHLHVVFDEQGNELVNEWRDNH